VTVTTTNSLRDSVPDEAALREPADRALADVWIDGATAAASGRVLQHVSPVTGEASGATVCASADEVTKAVDGAHAAFASWRRTAPGERAALLREAAAAVRRDADELGELLCRTTGRLLTQSTESARVAADLLEEASISGLGDAGRTLAGAPQALDVVRREPRGVVAVVTPWNDPYPAAAGLIAAALVTGNTVVHKPSERSALPGYEMARRIAECLPAGVLNIVGGDGETGEALVSDHRVALVAHVGSTAAGRRIAALAGTRGARVLLENGGKDSLLVDAGVDPAWAAEQIAVGAFTNTGQLCTSVERVYLHETVADAVVEELARRAESMTVGAPDDEATELGPLVDERQLGVVAAHVDAAVAAGARLVTGGRRLERPGCFYPPTVLDDCTDEMALLTEETFGPVAAVRRVASFEEALRCAGSGRYGLAATVLTPDLDHAMAAATELEVGTVKVNAVFGGAPGGSADPRRESGGGAGYGPDLLREMTVLKAVHLEAAR
jgi:succinate-semialdehyde dehydrogenase/glutarate-semialdehyde dehydrogenase